VSDFGFDAYAIGDLDASEDSDPLEIARDLIATGKPRSALDVLAGHHKRLADDPEYLMLCGEAWYAADDAPRAQHALLGAARLAPNDPRPLRLLADVLRESGQSARAERALGKARLIEKRLDRGSDPDAETALEEAQDDLIAFAEREARAKYRPVNPSQLWPVIGIVGAIGISMSGIAWLVTPLDDADESESSRPENEARATVSPPPALEKSPAVREEPGLPSGSSVVSLPPAPLPTVPAVVESIAEVTPGQDSSNLAPGPEEKVESQSPAQSSRPRRTKKARAHASEPRREIAPAPPDYETELATIEDPAELVNRADALTKRGDLSTAARFYRRALDFDPDYAPALVAVGRSYLRAEKYDDAMNSATRALELARGVDARLGLEAEALYQMGRVHHERGQEDPARQLLRQSASLPGTPAEAWFYLGESLSRDNSPAARDAYEAYLERRPNGHLSDRARRAIQ